MQLSVRRWGGAGTKTAVCVHGIAQHGGVFEQLAGRLADRGYVVLAIDLRGHGESGREPPWDTTTHVHDLLETVDRLGIERATWIGHSFGGRLAAALAATTPERCDRLVLLEPGLDFDPQRALQSAETERLDWSFASIEGALNALLSNASMVSPPHDVLAAYVADDLRRGHDGRYRFRFCPSAAVTAWSEATLAAPPVAQLPTLLVHAETSLLDRAAAERRYREALGDRLTATVVPNGHNVLWESAAETGAAIEAFLAPVGN